MTFMEMEGKWTVTARGEYFRSHFYSEHFHIFAEHIEENGNFRQMLIYCFVDIFIITFKSVHGTSEFQDESHNSNSVISYFCSL